MHEPARALLAVPALLALTIPAAAAERPAPPSIEVVVEATTAVKPDQAELELGVTSDRPTATAATAENARRMAQVIEALKQEVGPRGEVRTVGFSLSPRYGRARGDDVRPSVVAYTASNTVHVRTADVAAVGRLLDRAFKSGANSVDSVAFTLEDAEAAHAEALRLATAKARSRAAAMTAPLGLHVGNVLSVSEGVPRGNSR